MGNITIHRLLRSIAIRFLLWLVVFILLWLFSFTPVLMIALGLLAVMLSNVIFNFIWLYMPKRTICNLENKAVLITGCDSGFGNSLAQRLDEKGMKVYAGCLNPDSEGAGHLMRSCSDRLVILSLDVTSDSHVADAVHAVSSTIRDRELWAVVNNAGVGQCGEVEWTPVSACRYTMEVNAIGPYRVTQAFLPLLRRSRGRVIIVSSVVGRVTTGGAGPYCMSKHASVSFADALRREMLKWNVSVHCIEPWIYSTNMTNEKSIIKNMKQNWKKTPPNVHDDYGEGYIEECKKSIKKMAAVKRPDYRCSEVVDAMEHATVGMDPKIRYVPGLVGQIWTGLLLAIPVEIFDLLSYITSPRKLQPAEGS